MAELQLNDVELIDDAAIEEWSRDFDTKTKEGAKKICILSLVSGPVCIELPRRKYHTLFGKWGKLIGQYNPVGLHYKPLIGVGAAGRIHLSIEDRGIKAGSAGRVVWQQPGEGYPLSEAYWCLAGALPAFALQDKRFAIWYRVTGSDIIEKTDFGQLVISVTTHISSCAPAPSPISVVSGRIVACAPRQSAPRVENTTTLLKISAGDGSLGKQTVPEGRQRRAMVAAKGSGSVLRRLGGGGGSSLPPPATGGMSGGGGGDAGGSAPVTGSGHRGVDGIPGGSLRLRTSRGRRGRRSSSVGALSGPGAGREAQETLTEEVSESGSSAALGAGRQFGSTRFIEARVDRVKDREARECESE